MWRTMTSDFPKAAATCGTPQVTELGKSSNPEVSQQLKLWKAVWGRFGDPFVAGARQLCWVLDSPSLEAPTAGSWWILEPEFQNSFSSQEVTSECPCWFWGGFSPNLTSQMWRVGKMCCSRRVGKMCCSWRESENLTVQESHILPLLWKSCAIPTWSSLSSLTHPNPTLKNTGGKKNQINPIFPYLFLR